MFFHLLFLVGFRNKLVTLINWIVNYFSYERGTRVIIRKFNRETMKESDAGGVGFCIHRSD